MSMIARSYAIQADLDALHLTGRDLYVVLDILSEFEDQFSVEWATRARNKIAAFDERRVRVWYDDDTRRVIAVMHG